MINAMSADIYAEVKIRLALIFMNNDQNLIFSSKCDFPRCIFAKCIRHACLLSFASLLQSKGEAVDIYFIN